MLSPAFVSFWQIDITRNIFLSYSDHNDLQTLRLVSRDFNTYVTPILFKELQIHFQPNTFSRQARISALERIGHHVRHLSFIMPHTSTTFLPPLIAPDTLEEVTFEYQPRPSGSRPSSSSSCSTSRYGSPEINDLLIRHYPPIFHAATNVSAFEHALRALPMIQSLRISCPNQGPGQRYRRDAVDYALISLRIAIEKTNPVNLNTLVLDSIHPAATLYLRPEFGFGASPASPRVWRRITKLDIAMEGFSYGRDLPSDHLKILHSYLQSFPLLQELDFKWIGSKGPCPLTLDVEPCTSRPVSLDCAKACPESCVLPSCKPIKFRYLRKMRLSNATLDSSQAAAFITTHRKMLREFEFEKCYLRSGTWDDALAPLSRIAKNDDWRKQQEAPKEEVMEVPLILGSNTGKKEMECVNHPLWDDFEKANRGLQAIRKMSLRTKELIPDHMKRLLSGGRVGWH